jgi:hypothetical protein
MDLTTTQFTTLPAILPNHIPVIRDDETMTIQPQCEADAFLVMQAANRSKTPLIPYAGPAERAEIGLDLSALNQIQRHRTEEFLVTVESGILIGVFCDALVSRKQRMAHRYSTSRSLLSVLSETPFSLSETGFSPLQQFVTGIRAITGDGETIHYGGEIVKNVTGYDLNKLFIGSRNRYGVITAVTLKLEPLAELTRTFLFHIESMDQALTLMQKLTAELVKPEILTLFRTKTTFGWQILLSLSGDRAVVQEEIEMVLATMAPLKADLQELDLSPRALDQWIHKLDWCHPQEPQALVIKIALPQKRLMDFFNPLLTRSWLNMADLILPVNATQLHLRWISVNLPPIEQLEALKMEVSQMGGIVRILRAPVGRQSEAETFNRDPQAIVNQLEKRLQEAFDPNGILSRIVL